MTDFSPPPADVFQQVLAAEKDAYKKQGSLLFYSTCGNAILASAFVGALAVAGYAITKERVEVQIVAQDELGIYHGVDVNPSAMDDGSPIVVAKRWIKDVQENTVDMKANRRMRSDAIERLNLPSEEKDKIRDRAFADLEKDFGFAVVTKNFEFKPKGAGNMALDVTFDVETVDMRGLPNPEPRKLERYYADVQFVKVEPTAEIPDGLLIAPFDFVPMEKKNVKK